VADLATSFPGVSEALLRLYGAYTRNRLRWPTGMRATRRPDPVTEVRRFIAARRNWFPSLDARGTALAEAVAEAGDLKPILPSATASAPAPCPRR
jgi:hypothetical protein